MVKACKRGRKGGKQDDRIPGNIQKENRTLTASACARGSVATVGECEVLIKIHSASICGTDLHIYKWNDWASRSYRPAMPLGHEFGDTVIKIGSAVRTIREGDVVTAETHLSCGRCQQCRLGRGHTCDNLKLFNRLDLGCFAD
jgi:threonine 3-dehydrogenase